MIRFNTLFSFLHFIIARIIKLRLKVFYSVGRLRNLEEDAHDESVPSTCTINNTELAGKTGTGAILNMIVRLLQHIMHQLYQR